ncbi:redoxin domain-containing protein [Maribacter algarum]|uniref:Redoxin domain-containing protein n=1 Tax=Maribacter algarum (ex Zhang et al. 2020) TaxID=2578118 RepID=A0A5S3PGX1_9FLAO|nr:TlpA disulfide reductase family protein [Maribacter algarum]TMM53372.1 redoxin domain-containing protein [Maribacter algarum]
MKKQTVYTLLVIALILSFFVTPLGDFSKEFLNKTFAASPTIIPTENQGKISNYNWKLKRADWSFFNFEEAEGQVVFINFWATWHLPSRAQLDDIQKLYEKYEGDVKFYIITDQERELPEEMMMRKGYTFPITYQIIGEPSPIELLKPAGSYILDKKGNIVVHQTAIADWDNKDIEALLIRLISE